MQEANVQELCLKGAPHVLQQLRGGMFEGRALQKEPRDTFSFQKEAPWRVFSEEAIVLLQVNGLESPLKGEMVADIG